MSIGHEKAAQRRLQNAVAYAEIEHARARQAVQVAIGMAGEPEATMRYRNAIQRVQDARRALVAATPRCG